MDPFALLFLVGMVIFIGRLPVIGIYFRVLNTLMHEIGHAVMSLLMQGNVQKIELFSDAAGLATTGTRNWISRVMITLAGYPFASIMAGVSIFVVAGYGFHAYFIGLLVLLVISLLLWIRNAFGIMWISVFIALTALAVANPNEGWIKVYGVAIVAILMVESIMSAFLILRLSCTEKQSSGDAWDLQKLTKIPAAVWGTVFFAQSLVIGFYSLSFI